MVKTDWFFLRVAAFTVSGQQATSSAWRSGTEGPVIAASGLATCKDPHMRFLSKTKHHTVEIRG